MMRSHPVACCAPTRIPEPTSSVLQGAEAVVWLGCW